MSTAGCIAILEASLKAKTLQRLSLARNDVGAGDLVGEPPFPLPPPTPTHSTHPLHPPTATITQDIEVRGARASGFGSCCGRDSDIYTFIMYIYIYNVG